MPKPVAQPKRTRNAAATRDAILHSALAAFSRNGYFGSKEELFSAAVEIAFSDSTLFEGDSSSLAHRLTEAVIAKSEKDADPIDPLLLLLRSAPNPRAAEILRKSI